MPDSSSGKLKADEAELKSELIQIISSKFHKLKLDLVTEIKSYSVRGGKKGEETKSGTQCKCFETSGADNNIRALKI